MVHHLSQPSSANGFRRLPIHIITDFDPDGLNIANVYRFGSKALDHEGESSKVPDAQRVALGREHLVKKGIAEGKSSHCLLPLTGRDRRKARSMLLNKSDEMGVGTMLELQAMLMLNYKAELEICEDGSRDEDGLEHLLRSILLMP